MVVQFIGFLTLSTLICRGTDISKCFSESHGIRDNESRLYFQSWPQICKFLFTESSSEDWEQDFDIELTEEDIKAAEEVARKLNVSATDYTKLTGDQVILHYL